jgi:seryl-tRNA synthetase
MLDLEFIRNNPDKVKKAVLDKRDKVQIDNIIELDKKRRLIIQELDTLRHKRNQGSQAVAQMKSKGEDTGTLVKEMSELSRQVKDNEQRLKAIEPELNDLLLWVPNIPSADVPIGPDDQSNEVMRSWGQRAAFDFTPQAHWDIAKALDIIDFERAVKISGTSFLLFKGAGARLERALINFMIDLHTREHNYLEISPPYMVNRASMQATGQLPKLNDDMYHLKEDDMFLIPTAEVPVTNLYRDEVLSYEMLPKYFVAATPCFRYEAGSYGKDTRGLVRVHQFDKVELVKFVHPDQSVDELEKLLKNAEKVLQLLGLEYRVIKLSTGEMSFASAKTYDIEAWAPGLGRYLEVSSCSNFMDFQARRGNIRFRDQDGKMKFVHTLNGSGLALPRVVICFLETYQQKDGSIKIPDILKPYMGGLSLIGPSAK